MSCTCKIGGGPSGVCAFHRAEIVRRRKDKYDAAKQEWIIKQICRFAELHEIKLDPFPKEEQ
jgi:hypothetical protein